MTVNFDPSTAVDDSNYILEALPTELNISEAGSAARTILLQLTDGTSPIVGQSIIVHTLALENGTINLPSATTDASGRVQFIYTPPADELPTTTPVTITFSIENGETPQEANVTVNFDNATYTIMPDQNITVTNISTVYPISVALNKQLVSGDPIEPATGKIIVAEFLMPVNGKISQYEATVGSDGFAIFEYTSPDRTLPTSDVNVTFYYKDNHIVTGKTLLIFDPQVIDTVTDMYISPLSFTVTSPGEEQDITIVTVNSQNVGISTHVVLEQLTDADNTDYGQFDTNNITTNASGYAVVKYTAPTDLTGLVERNITVTELSQNITQELNIKFNTASQITQYEIVATVPGSFAVDSIDDLAIKIVEVGNPDNIIADGNVNEVNLTSQFSNMLLFANDTASTTYDALGENLHITVRSLTLSGVAVINVSASIFDGTNNVVITQSVPVTIISGPVSSMSMVYIRSTDCVSAAGLPADNYLIHAVDTYSNPAQGVQVTPTLINGIRADLEPDVARVGSLSGTVNPIFSAVDISGKGVLPTDRLIVTINSQRNDPSYLGNWSIDQVAGNDLHLVENYTPPSPAVLTDNLTYAIGSEDRILGTDRVVAHIVNPEDNYLTDGSGILNLEVCFDPLLAAHMVTLAAHVIDDGNRTGISTTQGLRWNEYTSSTVVVDNVNGLHTVNIALGLGGSISEPLIDLDVLVSSFNVEKKPHCNITTATSTVHTDSVGHVTLTISADGNTSVTGGVDTCSVEWNKTAGSILSEY